MSELPSSWTRATFGDVAAVVRGVTFPASAKESFSTSTNVCCLRTSNIQREVKWDDVYFIPRLYVKRDEQFVAPGDVLMSMANSYELVGKVAIANEVHFPTAFGAFLSAIRPTPAINGRFLFHLLRSDQVQRELRAGSSQTTNIANISVAKLSSIEAPLAPIAEQTRIADKLDAVLARVDACRDRLDRIPDILKRFRQSVLAAATSGALTEDWRAENTVDSRVAREEVNQRLALRRSRHPANKKFKEPADPDLSNWATEIPESWSVESVSAFAECLDHLRVPVTRNMRSNSLGLYPYYGANGQVDMVDEFIFDAELVLVTEDETFYGREKPIAYRTSGRCWVNNHAHVLLADDRFRADYLCFALMFYNVIPWLTGTTGRAKLTQGVLNSLPIAVPPQSEIEVIVRRVKTLLAFADRLEARYAAAHAQVEKLTPSLLAKAFRGELVPQDPDDEPASELLARIRAQRNAHVASPPQRGRGRKAVAL